MDVRRACGGLGLVVSDTTRRDARWWRGVIFLGVAAAGHVASGEGKGSLGLV